MEKKKFDPFYDAWDPSIEDEFDFVGHIVGSDEPIHLKGVFVGSEPDSRICKDPDYRSIPKLDTRSIKKEYKLRTVKMKKKETSHVERDSWGIHQLNLQYGLKFKNWAEAYTFYKSNQKRFTDRTYNIENEDSLASAATAYDLIVREENNVVSALSKSPDDDMYKAYKLLHKAAETIRTFFNSKNYLLSYDNKWNDLVVRRR